MKKLLLTLFLTTSFLTFAGDHLESLPNGFCYESPNVQVRNGLYFLPNQNLPFNGENVCVYSKNGQYHSQGLITNGELDGSWTWWKENGDIWKKKHYKDGKKIADGDVSILIQKAEEAEVLAKEALNQKEVAEVKVREAEVKFDFFNMKVRSEVDALYSNTNIVSSQYYEDRANNVALLVNYYNFPRSTNEEMRKVLEQLVIDDWACELTLYDAKMNLVATQKSTERDCLKDGYTASTDQFTLVARFSLDSKFENLASNTTSLRHSVDKLILQLQEIARLKKWVETKDKEAQTMAEKAFELKEELKKYDIE